MLISQIVQSLLTYINYRRNRNELTRLSDHLLRDIGLSRGEIEYYALAQAKVQTSKIPPRNADPRREKSVRYLGGSPVEA